MLRLSLITILIWAKSWVLAYAQAEPTRYSQLIVPFESKKLFDYQFNEAENALMLEILETRPEELEPLYNYDSRIVRRLIVKELSNHSSLVKIVLKDRNIQVAVYSFEEPYRIVVDMYDKVFKEQKDPRTGLPYLNQESGSKSLKKSFVMGSSGNNFMNIERMSDVQSMSEVQNRKPVAKKMTGQVSKRRLLQPKPMEINNTNDLVSALNKIPSGTGSQWKRNPVYIYRTPTSTLKTGKNYKSWMRKNAGKAISSNESLANYAAQMFDFGHEMKALAVYRKILYEDPRVFDKDAKHLWNLAEIHFGQRNLTLAEGYFRSVVDKFPDHPLSKYAQMRLLDVDYIRAHEASDTNTIHGLVDQAKKILTSGMPELEAQVLIRRVYWGISKDDLQKSFSDRFYIPFAKKEQRSHINKAKDLVESPQTAFLLYTLLIHKDLENDYWDDSLAKLMSTYIKRFKGPKTESFKNQLLAIARNNIAGQILRLAKKNKNIEVVMLLENLDAELHPDKNNREVAWAAAVSYRNTHRPKESLKYFDKSYSLSDTKLQRFQAQINKVHAYKKAISLSISEKNDSDRQSLTRMFNRADKILMQDWAKLTEEEKLKSAMQFKDYLVQNLDDEKKSKSMNKILLWSWNISLDSKSQNKKIPTNWKSSFRVNGSAVVQLSKLSKDMQQSGDEEGYRGSKELMKEIDPGSIEDKEVQILWADELSDLAESYRENNEYLSAGRTYALTGSKSQNWDQRAEALYKGGLLLYRSGRREEAIEAFQQAANDGNNLLYAQLAEKRLEQLQQ